MATKQQSNQSIFSIEMFEVNIKIIPQLFAYTLQTRGTNNKPKLGRRLADRFMRIFGGSWIWTEDVVITNNPQIIESLTQSVRDIRAKEPDIFKDLQNVIEAKDWIPTAQAQADFVAMGMFWDFWDEIQEVLKPSIDLDNRAKVERECNVRGWVVNDKPAISISISSNVIFRDDLRKYLKTVTNIEDIIGLYVADKTRSDNGNVYKGEIIEIAGKLDETIDRSHLLDIAKKEGSKELINQAEKGDYVVRVGNNEYEYVVSALSIVVSSKYYKRFGINTFKAQDAVWIKPSDRNNLVKKISEIAKKHSLILDQYMSTTGDRFSNSQKFQYNPMIIVGSDKRIEYDKGGVLLDAISRNGLYKSAYENQLNIGVINASKKKLDEAQQTLQNQLNKLGFTQVGFDVIQINEVSRIAFERAINQLVLNNSDLILAIIPDSDSENDDDWGPYYEFKSLMMLRNKPSQVVDAKTLDNQKGLPYVMQNVAFGISAKLGNIPYVLANQLDYADMVVGIDISRKLKKSGIGTQNVAAIAQVFHQSGQFSQCRVVETPIEGETIPAYILRSLFPLNEFENKRVIIHRDGLFRGDEVKIIEEHIKNLNGQAYFVEVIKSGSPRLYSSKDNTITAPPIGTIFRPNDMEAFLISSESKTATPNPLHIRAINLTIGKALHSVLMLTLMHYGSLKRPRLPVTIHYSDKIAYLALRGVKPTGGVSNDMYWL